MSMEEFNEGRCITKTMVIPALIQKTEMDPKEYERLTNDRNGMFKKWGDITNQSAIARFMREGLEPEKEYTKKEITDLCKEYNIRLPAITKPFGKDHTYGQMIITCNNRYKLSPVYTEAFKRYF